MIRRFDRFPDPSIAYRARPGVYVILPRAGSVLLTFQSRPEEEFQLPGGGIDPGETPLQALHREVLEETGWRIAAPRRLGAFRRFVFMPDYDFWAEKICHVYLARPVQKLADPTEPYHIAVWQPEKVAMDLLGNDGDRHFLQAILS